MLTLHLNTPVSPPGFFTGAQAARLRTPVLMFLVIPLSWLLWVFRTAREQLRSIFRNPGCHGDRVQQAR